ncbi:hypothetical protein [Kutzneria sp. NPDC052558]|uniref:hypothetical protein n=1 Tax=Kutzneria sp. NPDC052558 TaxID=3364121 RepID=UPI0037C618AA
MPHKGFTALVPLALATVAAIGIGAAAQAAPAVQADTQLVTIDLQGDLQHTIRHADGSWQKMGSIPGYDGAIYLTSAIVNGEENILVEGAISQGQSGLYTARLVRHTDGTWTQHASMPAIPDQPAPMSAVNVNGQLNLVVQSHSGPQVSVLNGDGSWSAFSAIPTEGHKLVSVAAATDGHTLRVAELLDDGLTIGVTDRTATGWTPLNITTEGLPASQAAEKIVATQTGGLLQIATMNSPTDEPGNHYIEHGIVDGGGKWSGFAQVDLHGKDNPCDISMTTSNGAMQLAYLSGLNYELYHTIRYPDGTWQTPGNVLDVTGGHAFGAVTIAG